MRKLDLLAVIAVLSLAGGTAVAQEKPAKPAKEKKICRGEATSGTRLAKKRVCKTRAEWGQESREGLDATKVREMNPDN